MQDVIKKSIEQLNEVLTKDKKLVIKDSTPLIDEKSKLESIDIVNLFVNLEKNLKEKYNFTLTFDEILENADKLKTIGSLETFINKKKMKKNKISINIISSFNHSNLISLLKNNKSYDFEINEVDYNQVFQVLTNPKDKIWKKKSNISLVWTTPEDIFPEFKKLIYNEKINPDILKEQVISFCSCFACFS